MRKIMKSFRVTEKESEIIRKNAAKKGMKESKYMREVLCYSDEDWISKQELISRVMKIDMILVKYELNSPKLTKQIRKEMGKLWEIL